MIFRAIGRHWDIWRLVEGFRSSERRNRSFFSPAIRGASNKLGGGKEGRKRLLFCLHFATVKGKKI